MTSREEKLQLLAEIEGFDDTMDLLEEYVTDSVTPGICMNEDCDYCTDTEPDSDSGWCEECETNTVCSCMMLAGII